jgi:hypothetical protein
MLNKVNSYFRLFANKELNGLLKLFSKKIILEDWEVSASGIEKVMKINEEILENLGDFTLQVINLDCVGTVVYAEIKICLNKTEEHIVLDKITFDDQMLIQQIRAYKG